MINLKSGNLLTEDAEALVNTVNCVGVMGKGIALQFKEAFPANYTEYKKACDKGLVMPGSMFTVKVGDLINPRYIINFPTKKHWKGNSNIEDIDSGLMALREEVKRLGITSIAIPPLGCGYGGLNWDDVRPRINNAFANSPEINVILYAPTGAPAPEKIKIATQRPRLTKARALLISLMDRYRELGYRLTLLEIQKLAYFLQAVGEPLKLKYEKSWYGPYAENLNFVLLSLEGHYTRGFGDGSRNKDKEIYLLPGAAAEATKFLAEDIESQERLEEVSTIIDGFETPYGMELLSTVHWVMSEHPDERYNLTAVIQFVRSWNKRKEKLLQAKHIDAAWKRLNETIFREEWYLSNQA